MQFQTFTWLYYLQFVLFPSSSKTPQTIIKGKKREHFCGWMAIPRYGNTTRVSWLCVLEGLCDLERVCVLEGCSACVSWKGVLGRIFWLCVLERLCIVEGLCVLEVCSYCVSWKDCESWKDALVNANYSPCPAPTPCFHLDISCKSLLLPKYTNKLLLTDSNVYCSRSIG